MKRAFSAADARRIALAAQGFGPARPAKPGLRALKRAIARLGLIQIDSVNAVVRSHYLPLFSRFGAYDRGVLDDLWYGKKRMLFEYWGHEASLIDLDLHPLLRWRMERAQRGIGTYPRIARFGKEQKRLIKRVYDEVCANGPLAAGDVAGHSRGGDSWWGWSDVKIALEYLFWAGMITASSRKNFARSYDIPERVFDPAILARATPAEADAQRELVRIASRAFGIATEADLRDYFRLDLLDARRAVSELVESGDLVPVGAQGWKQQAYLARDAVIPRKMDAAALLSPFDSLVWNRPRDTRIWNFDYRLEIYVPDHKRVHGYYVLPFVFGDALVARVDVRSRRAEGVLDVVAVHYESMKPSVALRDALHAECDTLGGWLGLEQVRFPKKK
jgi:uncharacterized protein YcaQ